jgi:A/G-specific adenine glycosylase
MAHCHRLVFVQREVMEWFEANGRDPPWRAPGFTPWGTLVSEFMLQQTPVSRVIPKLEAWLERWPTPAALAADSPGEAVRAWDKLGYPRRALWLHACAVAIVERFNGEVPRDVDALLSLPGIGPYTARAVAVFAYGAHEPVVDTNIRRVIARHDKGLTDQGAPREKQDLADMAALLPDRSDSPRFNQAVMELGAIVCTAKTPACDACPIASTCAWRSAGYPAVTASAKPKQKKYEGSDRQARGAILAVLRASGHPATKAAIDGCWPDAAQRGRALETLLRDGLVVIVADDTFALPS